MKWVFVLKALLIVGMLIFVKQIPDLINKVFGIDIKLKGGIGERLGEMAVVGEQAKKAWGAVKQAAKVGAGVAGLVASGPVGWGAAALGTGLGVGANQLWKRKIKDTTVGRGLSAFGSGASAVGKTAGSYLKGKGLVSGIKDAKKAYSESDFGLERIANKNYKKALKEDEKYNEKFGFKDGSAEDGKKSNYLFKNNVEKDLGKNRGNIVQNLHDANLKKATIDKISSDKDAITTELDALKINAKTTEAANAIESIKNAFATGHLSSNEMRTKLNALIDNGTIDSSSGLKISGKLDSIENQLDNNVDLKGELVDADGNLKLGSNLKEVKRVVEKKATDAKSTYDDIYKGSSENTKHEMDNYMSASDEIIRKTVDEQGKGNDPAGGNINTVGTHYNGSTEKENDKKVRVEIHSNPSNTTSNTSSDDTDDAFEEMMNAQIEANEERLNNTWKNQSTDDAYIRGTYEPQKNNNNSNDSYENIFADQYDNNDSNPFTSTDDE